MNENVNIIEPANAKIIDRCFRSFLIARKQEKMTIAPIKRATVILCVIFVIKRNVNSIEKPITANGLFKINTPLIIKPFFLKDYLHLKHGNEYALQSVLPFHHSC